MEPKDILEVGSKYSKNDLSELLKEKSLKSVREGVFSCSSSASYLLFVDLEKADKETRFTLMIFSRVIISTGILKPPNTLDLQKLSK